LKKRIDRLHKIEYNEYTLIVIKPLLNLAFSSPSARQGLLFQLSPVFELKIPTR
jgi:hypothetical protein